jgi:hypothetical protein
VGLLAFSLLLPSLALLFDANNNRLDAEITVLPSLPVTARSLQAAPTAARSPAAEVARFIDQVNTERVAAGLLALDVSAGLGQITSQWVRTMRDRNSMTLIQYLQLYGHLNVQIYAFPPIPADYIFDVLRDQCTNCNDPDYTRVGSYQSSLDANNYEVIIVLKGGN